MQTCQIESSLPTKSIQLPRSSVSKTQLANTVLSAHKARSNTLCSNLNRNKTSHDTLMGLARLAVDLGCEESLEELIAQKCLFGAFVNTVSEKLTSYVDDYTKQLVEDLLPSFVDLGEALRQPVLGFAEKVEETVGAMPKLRLTIYDEVHSWHQHFDSSVCVTAWMDYLDTFPYEAGKQENKHIVASVLATFEKYEQELDSSGVGMLADYDSTFDPDTLGFRFEDKPISKAELEKRIAETLERAPSYHRKNLEASFQKHETEINEYTDLIAAYHKGSREKTQIDAWFDAAVQKYPVLCSEGMIQSSSGETPFMLPLGHDIDFERVQDDFQSYDSPPYILKVKGECALDYVRNRIHASVIMGMLFTFCK